MGLLLGPLKESSIPPIPRQVGAYWKSLLPFLSSKCPLLLTINRPNRKQARGIGKCSLQFQLQEQNIEKWSQS